MLAVCLNLRQDRCMGGGGGGGGGLSGTRHGWRLLWSGTGRVNARLAAAFFFFFLRQAVCCHCSHASSCDDSFAPPHPPPPPTHTPTPHPTPPPTHPHPPTHTTTTMPLHLAPVLDERVYGHGRGGGLRGRVGSCCARDAVGGVGGAGLAAGRHTGAGRLVRRVGLGAEGGGRVLRSSSQMTTSLPCSSCTLSGRNLSSSGAPPPPPIQASPAARRRCAGWRCARPAPGRLCRRISQGLRLPAPPESPPAAPATPCSAREREGSRSRQANVREAAGGVAGQSACMCERCTHPNRWPLEGECFQGVACTQRALHPAAHLYTVKSSRIASIMPSASASASADTVTAHNVGCRRGCALHHIVHRQCRAVQKQP